MEGTDFGFTGDSSWTLQRNEKKMTIWTAENGGYIAVSIGDITRYLSAKQAEEMAVGFERAVERGIDENDEAHQAEQLRRAIRRVDDGE